MITQVTEQLCREAERLSLRFRCEHCAHFAQDRSACAHGYPVEAHLLVQLREGAQVTFCKEFELE